MAEEKKPKIDLKARLGKGGNVAAPTPTPGGVPLPVPAPVPVPAASAGVLAGPGTPVGPPPGYSRPSAAPALDPSNPLAAAVTPYRAPTPPPPAQPQRIEVDEMGVQMARKGARKQGLMAGLVAAVVLGIVGYIAGGSVETNRGRQKSVADAQSLAADATKAKTQLKDLADKVEAGRNALLKDHKYPDALAKELGGINVDYDGTKLTGVRFSGFPQDVSKELLEFITAVQGLNDRKSATASLLTRLQKPITEQLNAGQKQTIGFVVLLGKKDPSQNPFGMLAALSKPIEATNPQAIQLPAEFTAVDPTTRTNVTAPKYTKGDLDKVSALYVLPKSIEAACPSETSGQIAQLASQLNKLVSDIRGDAAAAPGGEMVEEKKMGLLERADKLAQGLSTRVH